MSSERSAQSSPQRAPLRSALYVLLYSVLGFIILVGVGTLCARSLTPVVGGPGAVGIAGLLVVAVAALYIWAYRRARVRETVIIQRPVEEVFRRLATEFFASRAAAIAHVAPPGTTITVEQTSAGPLGVGTTGHEVVEANGRRGEWFYLVTAYDPPHRFARTAHPVQAIVQIHTRYDFAPAPGGTRLIITSDFALRGSWRLFTPFYVGVFQRYLQGGTAQLKEFLEA
jgi:hypothetical protein